MKELSPSDVEDYFETVRAQHAQGLHNSIGCTLTLEICEMLRHGIFQEGSVVRSEVTALIPHKDGWAIHATDRGFEYVVAITVRPLTGKEKKV
jgi:hypothetical protein